MWQTQAHSRQEPSERLNLSTNPAQLSSHNNWRSQAHSRGTTLPRNGSVWRQQWRCRSHRRKLNMKPVGKEDVKSIFNARVVRLEGVTLGNIIRAPEPRKARFLGRRPHLEKKKTGTGSRKGKSRVNPDKEGPEQEEQTRAPSRRPTSPQQRPRKRSERRHEPAHPKLLTLLPPFVRERFSGRRPVWHLGGYFLEVPLKMSGCCPWTSCVSDRQNKFAGTLLLAVLSTKAQFRPRSYLCNTTWTSVNPATHAPSQNRTDDEAHAIAGRRGVRHWAGQSNAPRYFRDLTQRQDARELRRHGLPLLL